MTTVLVLGATGNTGAPLVRVLGRREGVTVRGAARRPGPHMRFDWADVRTHDAALDGVQRLYLIAPVGDADPIRSVQPFLHRAVRHGVERVVMLSSSALEFGDPGLGEVAAAVADTMAEWEILRPSWFMQNFVGAHPVADAIRTTGCMRTSTGGGRVPFIDARDIARCAAELLVRPQAENAEHRLTGPAALSYDEVAAVFTATTGKTVRHRSVSTSAYIDELVAHGYDRDFAVVLAALDRLIREGRESAVMDTVERLTGTPPVAFEEFLRRRSGAAA